MKPMKKKTSKSKVVEDSTSTIKNYFKIAQNVCANEAIVSVEKQNVCDSKSVYVQALKDRLKSYNGKIETDTTNATENNDTDDDQGDVAIEPSIEHGTDDGKFDGNGLVAEKRNRGCADKDCVLLRKKYDDLKKSHVQLCVEHCELSMKYNALLKVSTETVPSTSNDVTDESPPLPPSDNVFTANEIIVLESVPLEKKKDSTFILKCVEFAYKDNASSLTTKTLKGTLERIEIQNDKAVAVRPAKDPLTPEKVKRIEELFIKRVTKSKCLAGEFVERIKTTNINRHIATAIRNICSKEQPKEKNLKKNDDLNL